MQLYESQPQVLYLSNQTAQQLSKISISVSGQNPGDFIVSNNCYGFLNAQSSCLINVAFNPGATSLGLRTATVTITDSDPYSPHTFTVSGTALAAP